jgi:hypothetical protein
MKTCTKCGETKREADYPLKGGKCNGRDARCKACKSAYQRAHPQSKRHYSIEHPHQSRSIRVDFETCGPREDDRLECRHYYNGVFGCLTVAVKMWQNRPSVCMVNCPHYEPESVVMRNDLRSIMGTFVDWFGESK